MAKRRGRHSRRQRRTKPNRKTQQVIDGADLINSMPDEILSHILSFIPIDLAIRTSVLSRRWRYAWCELPCLHIRATAKGLDQTLLSYRAPKIMSFKLHVTHSVTSPQFDSWVEFAMSRNVEELSLTAWFFEYETYGFPDCFYLSSSLRKLKLVAFDMLLPGSSGVSWKFLRTLTLSICNLYDESIANILSGSPNLETLQLFYCGGLLERLDLTKSPRLGALEIEDHSGQMEIVAPHIRYLKLEYSDNAPCSLVDVSSLAKATLGIRMDRYRPFEHAGFQQDADMLQIIVLKMLAKLQNVEMLTFLGGYLLQILSLAEHCRVPFPTLKVQTLTVETNFVRSVIPSIARLLQNSPGLKKLVVHATYVTYIEDFDLDMYLRSQGLKLAKRWRSKFKVFPTTSRMHSIMSDCNAAKLKLLDSFLKLVLRNANTLEKIVICLGDSYFHDEQRDEELLQMAGTLSPNNNVAIEFKRLNR